MCSRRSTGASPTPAGLGRNQLQLMPYGEASQLDRYTPIGTLVNVT